MGLSTAGLIFKPTVSTPDEPEMIRSAFGDAYQPVPPSAVQRTHDIRLPGNIAVESANGALGVYNSEIAERVLLQGKTLEASLLAGLGSPEIVVVFCHFDSGDTFGYTIFEKGVRVRTRLYADGSTSDEGTPLKIELPWLQAETFVEDDDEDEELVYRNTETGEVSTESYVSARLLNKVVTELFGVCPWDEWDYRTKLNYYCNHVPE